MFQAVRKNFEGFTREKIEKADLSRDVKAMIGHSTDWVFKDMGSD